MIINASKRIDDTEIVQEHVFLNKNKSTKMLVYLL